jgi:hypothetical protein
MKSMRMLLSAGGAESLNKKVQGMCQLQRRNCVTPDVFRVVRKTRCLDCDAA